jgi:hypothetical protein
MRAVLALGLVAACRGSMGAQPISDAQTNDAPILCDAANPGVRVHLLFEGSDTGNSVNDDSLQMNTIGAYGATLQQEYDVYPTLDPTFHATATLRYPAGTIAGPASVRWYTIEGVELEWRGSATFTADPAACVDVDLAVKTIVLADAG